MNTLNSILKECDTNLKPLSDEEAFNQKNSSVWQKKGYMERLRLEVQSSKCQTELFF